MNKKSKNKSVILLKLGSIFTTKNAFLVGISQYELNKMVTSKIIEKVRRGIYRKTGLGKNGEHEENDLFKIAMTVLGNPSCICLWSAAEFYDLTDEIVDKVWVYVPMGKYSHLNFIENVRKRRPDWKIGVVKIDGVNITSIERTVIDILSSPRHFDDVEAIKIAKKALTDNKTTLKKLQEMAKKLDVYKKIKKKLEMLLALYA